ncbi:MAG: hypothetical protein QOI13_1535 [Paraburkholderia sp.]|jgi:hypothetical protein|nr:hypothetical protein [Paraburkholderia sp.]
MTTRINSGDGRQAQQAAEDARAGAEHSTSAHAQQTHASQVHMQRTKLAAKLRQENAQHAAFYRNRRFATSNHKPTSAAAQKLLRQLGQRPRPGHAAKERGKDGLAHEPREEAQGAEEKYKQHEKQEGHEKREEGDPQQNGQQNEQQNGQGEQQAPRDRQNRERREKRSKFAVKAGKAGKAARARVLPNGLQLLAERHRDSPDLREELATSYTKAVLRLTSKMERGGLLLPLLLLSNITSPRGELASKVARMNAQGNAVHALRGPDANTAASVGVLEQSRDLTLALHTSGIEYSDDEQSLAMVKQRLLDATADTPAATAKRGAAASGNSQEVRVAPVAPNRNP